MFEKFLDFSIFLFVIIFFSIILLRDLADSEQKSVLRTKKWTVTRFTKGKSSDPECMYTLRGCYRNATIKIARYSSTPRFQCANCGGSRTTTDAPIGPWLLRGRKVLNFDSHVYEVLLREVVPKTGDPPALSRLGVS